MFLRLTPVVAGGRAVAALAVTCASMSGHANAGHAHGDVARAALGFLVLLATSWMTERRSTLLLGALVGQLLVHGSLHFADARMLGLHIGAAILAGALTWHFEGVWNAATHALLPLFRAVFGAAIPAFGEVAVRVHWRNPFTSPVHISTSSRRGPPVFA